MPVRRTPVSGHSPTLANSDHALSKDDSDGRVRKVCKDKELPDSDGVINNPASLRERKVAPKATHLSVNPGAVDAEHYKHQLGETIKLMTQLSFVNHIPDLKKLGNHPDDAQPDMDFTIMYRDNGKLFSVVPPDESMRANPEKYKEIMNKLLKEVGQVENQYHGQKKADLIYETANSEARLESYKQALTNAGKPLPDVNPSHFLVPLDSMTKPQPLRNRPVQPNDAEVKNGGFALNAQANVAKSSSRHEPVKPPQPAAKVLRAFNLDSSNTGNVHFISEDDLATLNQGLKASKPLLKAVYLGFREADTDWLSKTDIKISQKEPSQFERFTFENKKHQVLKKYEIKIPSARRNDYTPGDGLLLVEDVDSGQIKLVRTGSFDGEDIGGGGYPGYSKNGALRAFNYLKNRVSGNQRPYQNIQTGAGGNVETWGCGFHALQVAIKVATGYDVPFPVLVSTIEAEIDKRSPEDQQKIRNALAEGNYGFTVPLLQGLLGDTNRYRQPPFNEVYSGSVLFAAEKNSRHAIKYKEDFNKRGDTRIIDRASIENHDFNKASTVVIGQGQFAYAVSRIRALDGDDRYLVYDPHNFHYETDYFTNPEKGGLTAFATAKAAFDFISTKKGGASPQGVFDGFYSIPDMILQDIQKKAVQAQCELEKSTAKRRA